MLYSIFLSKLARAFLASLDKKSKSIYKKNLQKLSSPHPGQGSGNKERLIKKVSIDESKFKSFKHIAEGRIKATHALKVNVLRQLK